MALITDVLCAVLIKERFMALINDVQFAADSMKIDWKAVLKLLAT